MEEKTTYFVDGEKQTTTHKTLTPKEILDDAGFKPSGEYELIENEGDKDPLDSDKPIDIKEDEEFTTVFNGQTPVSEGEVR